MGIFHYSVMCHEILDVFQEKNISYFLDGTLGAGGHSEAILNAHPEIKTLIGVDQDAQAREIAKKTLEEHKDRVNIFALNFESFQKALDRLGNPTLDGILLDIGVSSMQLDQTERGFSFQKDGPLDMRMNRDQELTAYDLIRDSKEKELQRIFREYGEEPRWRLAAKAIVEARKKQNIQTTHQLGEVLKGIVKGAPRRNPLTRIFQALRIAVNRELIVLEDVLPQLVQRLSVGGRLAVLTFHSLEDRIVKQSFRDLASSHRRAEGDVVILTDRERKKDPLVKILTPKPILPKEDELRKNPRSRSAKLRVVEKIDVAIH